MTRGVWVCDCEGGVMTSLVMRWYQVMYSVMAREEVLVNGFFWMTNASRWRTPLLYMVRMPNLPIRCPLRSFLCRATSVSTACKNSLIIYLERQNFKNMNLKQTCYLHAKGSTPRWCWVSKISSSSSRSSCNGSRGLLTYGRPIVMCSHNHSWSGMSGSPIWHTILSDMLDIVVGTKNQESHSPNCRSKLSPSLEVTTSSRVT